MPDLVSVGIPCYNRIELLARAVKSVQAQTHNHLEIIVSDNASSDPAIEVFCQQVAAADSRVTYHRQNKNLGAMPNFEYVLRAARGNYFMWAADDDWIEPDFVERCVAEFGRGEPNTVLVVPEAQYETPNGAYCFFPEGSSLRAVRYVHPSTYPAAVLGALYGNIIYGLYRRDSLFHASEPLTRWIGSSGNELPFFLLLASKGAIRCIDYIGFHKRAPLAVCRQAEWEQIGGWLPTDPLLFSPKNARSSLRYHRKVFGEITVAVAAMDIPDTERERLLAAARTKLRRHFFSALVGWKPLRRARA